MSDGDLKYFVACIGGDSFVMYHYCEPERVSGFDTNSHVGGFTYHLGEAIGYNDLQTAEIIRNRMQKIYIDYDMYIITKQAKELFVARLS